MPDTVMSVPVQKDDRTFIIALLAAGWPGP